MKADFIVEVLGKKPGASHPSGRCERGETSEAKLAQVKMTKWRVGA
jgi:hypothetical protein